ncbi:unnamed protein product [Notodromas monacha]|uniref:YDG domain-containing protein n=1 Tax=Notodromas monacha TaxID=399045 RepID=A0A7R9G9E1_9CRUS|nr:unnamed protein product [Notodromas monacha]CAG0914166.1 unnamed protein product [Notodromas monacha]
MSLEDTVKKNLIEKRRILAALNSFKNVQDLEANTSDLQDISQFEIKRERLLKDKALKSNAVIKLRKLPSDLKSFKAPPVILKRKLITRRKTLMSVGKENQVSRRSSRLSLQPAAFSYRDLLDDDDEGKRRKVKRRRSDDDEPWSGKQRSSQLSRGELKPLIKRENSYGPIDDLPVGTWWQTRMECSRDGIHRPPVSGIASGKDGAFSIALSGGYPDNVDEGDRFWYTGEGGRDLSGTKSNPKNLRTAPQSKDQDWSRGNMSLYRSFETKNPVRVVRGFSKNKDFTSDWAPESGYRYDGLYQVTEWKTEIGKSGFSVFKFRFERISGQDPIML